MAFSVSATTRPMRPSERDGVDYHFLSPEEFGRREAAGEFLETASYEGHRYGTLTREIRAIVEAGRHAVLDIEVEGGRQVRRHRPDAVLIFILPPAVEVLTARLEARKTDDLDMVAGRLLAAAEEVQAAREYDYVVVNDDLERAVHQVEAIVEAEARRVGRHPGLSELIESFRHDVLTAAAGFRERARTKEHNR